MLGSCVLGTSGDDPNLPRLFLWQECSKKWRDIVGSGVFFKDFVGGSWVEKGKGAVGLRGGRGAGEKNKEKESGRKRGVRVFGSL